MKGWLNMGKFDEFFDDVVVNAKAAVSAVSEKANGVYTVSKHKISAAETRSEINKKLRDLGVLTYKQEVHGTDNSVAIKGIVSEIIDLKENLEIINQNIAMSKNQKRCPECEALVPKNSVFCNICGAKFDTETSAESESNEENTKSETV